MEKISIILRTNQRYLLLGRALGDIMSQTFKDWKIILVNDGGDIETIKVLIENNKIPSRQIKIVHLKEKQGLNISINAGVKEVEGEYVVVHDDDDSWDPSFLEKTSKVLDKNPQYGGVTTHTQQVIETINNDQIKTIKTKTLNNHIKGVVSFSEILKNNVITTIGFVYRSSVYKEIGIYDKSLEVLEDWDFNLRFMAKYDIYIIEEVLASAHVRKQKNITEAFKNTVTHGREKHLMYDTIIRNKYLREDMTNNQIGLGVMLNLLQWSDNRLMRHIKKILRR